MTYNLRSLPRPADRAGGLARIVLFVLAVSAAACGGSTPDGGTPGGAAAGGGRGAMPPMPVEIVTLTEQPVEDTGEYVGVLKSRRSTTIQPQVEGILTRILAASGDRVSAGTPLFEIDAAPQQAGLASLQSVRAARQADAALAAQQAQRAQALFDVGAMSQQELEQAAATRKAAEAQLNAVEEQIRQLQAELAYYRVTAPTAGVIGDIPNRVGDRVTKATELTTIHDNTGLEVYISVPLPQAPLLKQGLTVRLVDDEGMTIATERVSFVAPAVDDETQTVLVKAPVDARGGRFRTDQFVRALVVFDTVPGLKVPLVSVLRIGGQQFVYLADAGPGGGLVARQRPVELGRVIGNEYVVRSGLKAGDRLIVSGIQKIGDGAPVAAAPPPAPAGAPTGPARGGGA
jgi:RND family efflux transporter MFP subunit